MKPSIFVDDKVGREENSPLVKAMRVIGEAFGAISVPNFATPDGTETDIIIVGSATRALYFLKETESTIIGIFVFPKSEEAPSVALAERYPTRVRVMMWEEFTDQLRTLIAEKSVKEEA